MRRTSVIGTLALMTGCAATGGPLVAKLGRGDARGFALVREAFESRNPGYGLEHVAALTRIEAREKARIVFVQNGTAKARVAGAASDVTVGDIATLRVGQTLISDQPLGAIVFDVPEDLPPDIPAFIRPDQDPRITDTPGGCATERGAYRHILLTWLKRNGPYTFHALNAHRVRITDSFTHYHPKIGGFDEFYLVQMTRPGAKLITSDKASRIEKPSAVARDEVSDLLDETPLEVGDLVYLPRGLVHRGTGGVLAQVITVPGFVPGSEVGIDHHLRAINERFQLKGRKALPLNLAASMRRVRR